MVKLTSKLQKWFKLDIWSHCWGSVFKAVRCIPGGSTFSGEYGVSYVWKDDVWCSCNFPWLCISTNSCFCVLCAPPLFPLRHWNLTVVALAHMSGLRHIALMRNRVCQTLWPLDWARSPGCSAASVWAWSWCWMNRAEVWICVWDSVSVTGGLPPASTGKGRGAKTQTAAATGRSHGWNSQENTQVRQAQVDMKWTSTLFCKCMLLILLGMIHLCMFYCFLVFLKTVMFNTFLSVMPTFWNSINWVSVLLFFSSVLTPLFLNVCHTTEEKNLLI